MFVVNKVNKGNIGNNMHKKWQRVQSGWFTNPCKASRPPVPLGKEQLMMRVEPAASTSCMD